MSKTYTINMTLSGFTASSGVKSETLAKYKTSTTVLKFGSVGEYATGYAVRADWPSNNANVTHLKTLASSSITSITFNMTCESHSYGIKTRYGVLVSSSGSAEISSPSTVTVAKSETSKSINITSLGIATYGYGFGGTDGSASNTKIKTITVVVVTKENDYNYVLNFNGNGGSGVPTSLTGSNTALSPSYTFKIPTTVPTRTGYTFSGWSKTSSGSAQYSTGSNITVTVPYDGASSYTSSNSTMLYAVWTKNSYTVKIQCLDPENAVSASAAYFDVWYSDNSTVQSNKTSLSVSKKYGDTIYINNVRAYQSYFNIKSVSGMTSDGNGQYHYTLNQNSANYTISITTSRKTYTISYNANGGSGAPSSQTKYGGVSATISSTIPTREGYTFVKWNTASNGSGTNYNPGATYSTNSALTLYAIWVASSSTILLSDQSVEIGDSVYIYINKIQPDATHLLSYTVGGTTTQIEPSSFSDFEKLWTVPSSLISSVSTSTVAITISCTTFINGAQSGVAQTATLTASVPRTYQPTVAINVVKVNTNSTVNGWGILLQGYSKVTLTATATMAAGASVVSYKFTGPGVSYTGSNNSVTSSIITTAGLNPWSVIVTDSRGRTATATWDYDDFEVYEYSTPSISSASAQRTDSTGVSSSGLFLKAKAYLNFSSANNHNSITAKSIKYKKSSDSSWTDSGIDAVYLACYTWSDAFGAGLIDSNLSYNVQFSITDALGNSATITTTSAALKGIGLGLKNDRVRLGGVPIKAGLQVDWAAELNGTTKVTGATTFTNPLVDITQRRATKSLAAVGWYRVLKCTVPTAQSNALGSLGILIEFFITKQNSAEAHNIKLFLTSSSHIVFSDEKSYSNTLEITKIRYAYNTTSFEFYVDIYYNTATSRPVNVDYSVHCSQPTSHQPKFTTMNLSAVADAPSGETIVTTYTFNKDYFYPVTSVNGKTGAVTLTASDVGAKPSSYSAPVTKVNNKTGAVTLTLPDLGDHVNVAAGSTQTYTLANSTRHVFFVIGAAAANQTILVVGVTSTGTITQSKIGSADNITTTTSTNTYKIKTASYTADIVHLQLV